MVVPEEQSEIVAALCPVKGAIEAEHASGVHRLPWGVLSEGEPEVVPPLPDGSYRLLHDEFAR